MPSVKFATDGREVAVANIFCIGRNYAAHAAELGNQVEETPLVFIKPTSALHAMDSPLTLPAFSNDVHYETELVLLIGKGGKDIPERAALEHVAGYGVGLDLTARDIQSIAKQKGLPWTLCKGFDGAACVSAFLPPGAIPDIGHARFAMSLNGTLRQIGDTSLMLFGVPYLIHYLSTVFTLQAGDLVYTGTPEGVGKLNNGDRLSLTLMDQPMATLSVA